MIAEKAETAVLATPVPASGESYLAWSSVMGGSVVAIAISAFLIQFGAAVGLSAGEPLLENGTASWNVVVAGLWVVWVALASAAAGGYIAGRMRSRWPGASDHEVEFRDGVHGLVVWAVASLAAGLSLAFVASLSAFSDTAVAVGSAKEVSAAAERIVANSSVIVAFSGGAAAAVSAGTAWFAAKLGGEHRDQEIDVNTFVPFYKK